MCIISERIERGEREKLIGERNEKEREIKRGERGNSWPGDVGLGCVGRAG